MNFKINAAIGDAMSLLRTSDVAGATLAIQRALTGQNAAGEAGQPSPGQRALADAQPAAGRRLGDVLRSLRAHRASQPAAPAKAPAAESDPRFTSRSHRSAAGLLNYKLYVPLDRDRELALVVMLHGCTQDPDDFARGTQMNRLADEFGLVVAYPHQPRSANAQGCWNWFDQRHQRQGSGEPMMLAELAKALAGEFSIKPGRVFAAGLSAGAAMADVLAETHPELFSAVGVHSGLPYGAARDVVSAFAAMKGTAKTSRSRGPSKGCRKIIFHGAADATVNASNGEELFERMQAQHPGSAIVIADMRSGGVGVTRKLLTARSGDNLGEHWLVEGAGHAWSGGNASGSFTEARGPDASREMIRFFLD